MSLLRISLACLALLAPAAAFAQNDYIQPYGTAPPGYPQPLYQNRSDYYRDYPRDDAEPFRCTYATDGTCSQQRQSAWRGDPRDDPEPFRCTYSTGVECGGANNGLQ